MIGLQISGENDVVDHDGGCIYGADGKRARPYCTQIGVTSARQMPWRRHRYERSNACKESAPAGHPVIGTISHGFDAIFSHFLFSLKA
jgi:hypothetical protein